MNGRSIWIGRELPLHLLEWEDRGGTPLLLLHGMAGNAHWWDAAAPLLSGPFNLKALDFHGHGDSAWLPEGGYDIPGFVRDIETAREALGWERMVLCGHSMGALLALEYARRHPERLFAAVGIDFMPEYRESREKSFLRRRRPRQPVYRDRDAMIERFHLQPPESLLTAEEMKRLAEHCLRPADGGYTWKTDWRVFSLRYGAVWPLLPGIRTPCLILRGERSSIMERQDFERVVRSIPGAQGGEIARAYHHVPLDAPADLAAAVAAFCAEMPPQKEGPQ